MGNKKNVLKANKVAILRLATRTRQLTPARQATRPKLLLSLAKTYAPSSTSPLLTAALPGGS